MTAVKLKNIEGVMVERPEEIWEATYGMGFDRAITKQGEVQITLNREKLRDFIQNFDEIHIDYEWGQLADAIIKELPTLLERVK